MVLVKSANHDAKHGGKMRDVPVRRSSPPTTPFGAWLLAWMDQHPEWTHQALADEVGVSKGLISQWIGGTVKQVKPVNLDALSRVTGEPLANLERMVYGRDLQARDQRRPAEPTISLTPDQLEAMLQRAAERAVRQVLDELAEEARAGEAPDEQQPPSRRPSRPRSPKGEG